MKEKHTIKVRRGLIFSAITLFLSSHTFAKDYYVDATNGSNNNNGNSRSAAWQNFDHINTTQFQPGDRILLKSGSVWNQQLKPMGSGSNDNPIIIDSYGGSVRPIINGQGTSNHARLSGTVMLQDQENWTIRNLEVTNKGDNQDDSPARAGIVVFNTGTAKHNIVIENNYVHDVNSNLKGNKISGGIVVYGANVDEKGNYVEMPKGDPDAKNGALGFVNTKVINNVVENVAIEGIRNYLQIQNKGDDGKAVQPGDSPKIFPQNTKNSLFAYNTVKNVAGDGIVLTTATDGSKVTGNKVVSFANEAELKNKNYAGLWVIASDGVAVEKNVVTDGVYGFNDGTAYDIDLFANKITFENNVSKNNNGGAILFMDGSTNGKYVNNLSVNDGNSDKQAESKIFFYLPTTEKTAPEISDNLIVTGEKTQNIIHSENKEKIAVNLKNNTIIAQDSKKTKFTDFNEKNGGIDEKNPQHIFITENNRSNIDDKHLNTDTGLGSGAGDNKDSIKTTAQIINKITENKIDINEQKIELNSLGYKVDKNQQETQYLIDVQDNQNIVINNHAAILAGNTNSINQLANRQNADELAINNQTQIINSHTQAINNHTEILSNISNDVVHLDQRVQNLDKSVGELKTNITNINNEIKSVKKQVNDTAAINNALAGLYQPYNIGKFNLTAAVGGHNSAMALAVGTGYRVNNNVSAKVGVAASKKSVGYNAAVDFEF